MIAFPHPIFAFVIYALYTYIIVKDVKGLGQLIGVAYKCTCT